MPGSPDNRDRNRTLGEMIVDFIDSKQFTYSWVGALVLGAVIDLLLKYFS